jgi:hypothetical protein
MTTLPEILDARHLAGLFGVSLPTIRRAMVRGDLGATFFLGKRRYVRRDEMLAALRAREANACEPPLPWADGVHAALGERS